MQNEKLFPIPQAIELATGQRIHPATTHRWRLKGVSGVRLETVKLGGKRLCSVESVHRFVAATTSAADEAAGLGKTPPRTNRQREAAIKRAERELAREGI